MKLVLASGLSSNKLPIVSYSTMIFLFKQTLTSESCHIILVVVYGFIFQTTNQNKSTVATNAIINLNIADAINSLSQAIKITLQTICIKVNKQFVEKETIN